MKFNKVIYSIFIFSLFYSCNKKEFAIKKSEESTTRSQVIHSSSEYCTNFTLVKPRVDFLFIWDNSSGSYFINDSTQASLRSLINKMSEEFDYRIVLAPLIDTNTTNPTYFVMTENTNGMANSIINSNKIISTDSESRVNAFKGLSAGPPGSLEEGFARTQFLLEKFSPARSEKLFRSSSKLFVILMSNGNENSHKDPTKDLGGNESDRAKENINDYKNIFINLKQEYSSDTFRFMSLVAHDNCSPAIFGNQYINMSSSIYYTNGNKISDQNSAKYPDSFDICGSNVNNIFEGANNAIQSSIFGHRYKYWPVAASKTATFDPGKIEVTKSTDGVTLTQDDLVNGFKYLGFLNDVPLREGYFNDSNNFVSSPGEFFTGHVIQLFGNAKAIYPECLVVKTQTPAEYYGYVVLQQEPDLSTLKVVINGTEFQESQTNGWEYLGFITSKNIKIKSPSEPNVGGIPAENKTGYFLKLHGNAIHSNGSPVDIIYLKKKK